MCTLGAGGNLDSVFGVEKGAGTIIIARPLDAEQRSFYNLTLEVTDGSNTASTQVLPHSASLCLHTGTHPVTSLFILSSSFFLSSSSGPLMHGLT